MDSPHGTAEFLELEEVWTLPDSLPFNVACRSTDEDGATGAVVHEVLKLDGCTLFDGLVYGDGDGLLENETMVIGVDELCTLYQACGQPRLESPVLQLEATDCGGNLGVATKQLYGSVDLMPGLCGT